MKPRKNLLLLTPDFSFGGAQRAVHYMGQYLSEYYNVYECVFNTEEPMAFKGSNTLIDLEVPAGKTFFGKIWNFWLRCHRVRGVKRKYKIDITISHLEGADYVNIFSKVGDKTIVCIQGSKLYDGEISGLAGWLRKKMVMPLLYRMVDHIVPVSRDIVPELVQHMSLSERKVTVIENACDVEMVNAKKKEPLQADVLSIMQRYKVLITVGRMANQKNQLAILPIVKDILDARRDVKFFLLGDGPLRNETIAEMDKLGLTVYYAWETMELHDQYDVYCMGFQSNPFNFIVNSSLFVFPSLWEGFPLALIEALACDIPVVTSDCPTGPREIADGRILVRNEKLSNAEWAPYAVLMPLLKRTEIDYAKVRECWKEVILDLLNDDNRCDRYKKASSIRVECYFGHRIYKRWQELIDQVCN